MLDDLVDALTLGFYHFIVEASRAEPKITAVKYLNYPNNKFVWYTLIMKNKEKYLRTFCASEGFASWANRNPISSKDVIAGINEFLSKFENIPGAGDTLKALALNAKDEDGQWWGFLSEIRCALWLSEMGLNIDCFNIKTDDSHNADISVDGIKIDVVSFGADFSDPKTQIGVSDTKTVENLAKKINSKFDIQKADMVICDDIFSNDSNNFPLAPYFFEEAETTRKEIFQINFGERQDKILVISFTSNMIKSPTIRFCGKSFRKLIYS